MILKLINNILSVGKKAKKEEPKKVANFAIKKAVAKKSTEKKPVASKATKVVSVKKTTSKEVEKPTTKVEAKTKQTIKPPLKKSAAKIEIPKVQAKSIIKKESKNPVAKKSIPAKPLPKKEESVKAKIVSKPDTAKADTSKTTKATEPPKMEPVKLSGAENADGKKLSKKAKEAKVQVPPPLTVPRPSPDGKRKVIVDYKNVPDEVLKALSEKYPHSYNKGIIKFTNAKKEIVSAVPIELGDTTYLVKVSTNLQKMVDDYDEDELFASVPIVAEKEISVGAGGDFDDFDKSDEDDSPKRKSKGTVKSASDMEYGFDDDDDDDGDDDDDDDDDDDVAVDDDDDDDE